MVIGVWITGAWIGAMVCQVYRRAELLIDSRMAVPEVVELRG